MLPVTTQRVLAHERGLLFHHGELIRVLPPGRYWLWNASGARRIDRVSVRAPWLLHEDLDVIARSGLLRDEATILDLKDHERAIVRIDGRVARVLGPGLHICWNVFHQIDVEVLDAREILCQHPDLPVVLQHAGELMNFHRLEADHSGVLFLDGKPRNTLGPGLHGFWKGYGHVQLCPVDLREVVTDVAGQDIMTADKVTLRLNAVVTWRIVDPQKAVSAVEDYRQALYREAQLGLRAVVGTHPLERLLADKDDVAAALLEAVRRSTEAFGVQVTTVGIRDVLLPGEMKELLNKVTEARTAAEAALITRREETAAMRSQANTARLLESNPMLMRLRELEALERVSENARLQVRLGEGGLTERLTNLL